jgi:hypothetical protein
VSSEAPRPISELLPFEVNNQSGAGSAWLANIILIDRELDGIYDFVESVEIFIAQ